MCLSTFWVQIQKRCCCYCRLWRRRRWWWWWRPHCVSLLWGGAKHRNMVFPPRQWCSSTLYVFDSQLHYGRWKMLVHVVRAESFHVRRRRAESLPTLWRRLSSCDSFCAFLESPQGIELIWLSVHTAPFMEMLKKIYGWINYAAL